MNKKRVSKLFLVLFLLVGIGVTIAYFFNTSTFSNIFQATNTPTIITREKFKSPDDWEPGDTTPKTITTTNVDSDDNICIRLKMDEEWVSKNGDKLPLYQNGNRAAIINMINQDKWKEATDGWYYYQLELAKGETSVSPIESVTFNPLIESDIKCTESVDGTKTTKDCVSSGDGYDGGTYTLTLTTEAMKCENSSDVWKPENWLLTTYIKKLYNDGDVDLSNVDPNNNIRYVGSTPNNYVTINNEKWRIIGVFNTEDENGNSDERVKLIKSMEIGSYAWDVNDSYDNFGCGVNQWGDYTRDKYDLPTTDVGYDGSKLMQELNGDYLSYSADTSLTTTWYTNQYFYYNDAINDASQDMIDTVIWYTKPPNSDELNNRNTITGIELYNAERDVGYGKFFLSTGSSAGGPVKDSISRFDYWIGKVGLMYTSDYIFATSGGIYGRNNCLNLAIASKYSEESECISNNWLKYYDEWTITPYEDSNNYSSVYKISSTGKISPEDAYVNMAVRPTIYLKSSVKLINGTGTSTDPYQIGL